MPTPPVKSDSIINHLTDGTRSPYSIDAEAIFRTSVTTSPLFSGGEPDVVHEAQRHHEHRGQDEAAQDEGHAEAGLLGDQSSEDRAAEHRHPGDDLPAPEHRLQLAGEARRLERVHQPRLHRAGKEREAETDEHRDDRPLPEGGMDP